jgi:hypothetical protein
VPEEDSLAERVTRLEERAEARGLLATLTVLALVTVLALLHAGVLKLDLAHG